MKLTKRQQHILWSCGLGVLFWTLSVSGVLFMTATETEMNFAVPPLATILEFYGRALPLTVPFGIGTGLFIGWASMPHKPVTRIRFETLEKRVTEALQDKCSDEVLDLITVYAWAERAGWHAVEERIRNYPDRYPVASKLLAQDAEIIPFKQEA